MTELIDALNNEYDDTVLGDYQQFVDSTALSYVADYPLIYPALGLAGETGEVVEKVKKLSRLGPGWSPADREYFILELGDVLWYVTRMASILDIDLDEIVDRNIEKLTERRKNGK